MTVFSGALIVAVLSLVVVFFINVSNVLYKIIFSIVVSFSIANLLYWFPCLTGAMCDEYITWAPFIIVQWMISGFIVSLLFQLLFKKKI